MKKVSSSSEEYEIIYILGLGIKVLKPPKTTKRQSQKRVIVRIADKLEKEEIGN